MFIDAAMWIWCLIGTIERLLSMSRCRSFQADKFLALLKELLHVLLLKMAFEVLLQKNSFIIVKDLPILHLSLWPTHIVYPGGSNYVSFNQWLHLLLDHTQMLLAYDLLLCNCCPCFIQLR